MMILGTWFGAWVGYQWGPWTGVAFGVIGGALGAMLHAIATVTFNVNHIVSGVALNILALLLAILLAVGAAYLAWKRKYLPALITAVIPALMFVWYVSTDDVPKQLVGATPYIVTLLVLSLSAQSLRTPKADGLPYRKGQGE
jgi:ABC-type uncharacterized transport system permease subunit